MMNKPIKAIIWDLDGTLIDSAAYHWEAWQEVMAAENFKLDYDQYVADFGKRNDEILRGRLGADISDEFIRRISLAKEEKYRAAVGSRGLDLLPGAAKWLEGMKKLGLRQALGTSAPRGNIEAVFDAVAIARYFDAVMSAEEVKHGKPHPDVFLAAAGKLEIPAQNCLVVEDAPAGVEAARRAGMKVVGVRTTHPDLEADLVVDSLDLLPDDFYWK